MQTQYDSVKVEKERQEIDQLKLEREIEKLQYQVRQKNNFLCNKHNRVFLKGYLIISLANM